MKRTRHKRLPSLRRRALELVALHPEGCTEAVLAAENIPPDVLIDLVKTGLVVARNERFDVEAGPIETTRMRKITETGMRVLAARKVVRS
jgi:hypothetical protein